MRLVRLSLEQYGAALKAIAQPGGFLSTLITATTKHAAREFFLYLPVGAPSPVGPPKTDKHSGLYRGSHRIAVGRPEYARLGLQPAYPIPGAAEADSALAALRKPGQSVFVTDDAGAGVSKSGQSYARVLERGRHVQSYTTRQGTKGSRMGGSKQAPRGIHSAGLAYLLSQKGRILALAKADAEVALARSLSGKTGGAP